MGESFSALTLEQERRVLSLQADDNRTAVYYFCAEIHHLHSIQSAIDGLRTCHCSCSHAMTYLLLVEVLGSSCESQGRDQGLALYLRECTE